MLESKVSKALRHLRVSFSDEGESKMIKLNKPLICMKISPKKENKTKNNPTYYVLFLYRDGDYVQDYLSQKVLSLYNISVRSSILTVQKVSDVARSTV